jgi:hypothetical protein
MTAEPHIDYEALAQGAMRAVVRTVLQKVAKTGLPGEHHFYIAFNTKAPGVTLSQRLRERYPEEMTVVLQHRFWDLTVTEDRFEVNLTFDSIPERLVVPFTAIKVFFDPSVPYGLQFDDSRSLSGAAQMPDDEPAEDVGEAADSTSRPAAKKPASLPKKPRSPRKPAGEKAADKATAEPVPEAEAEAVEPAADSSPKVVKLDAFRKK